MSVSCCAFCGTDASATLNRYVPPKDGVWLNNVPTVKAGGMGTKGKVYF